MPSACMLSRGVTAESIGLTVEQNVLMVRAERRPDQSGGAEMIVAERPAGVFTRQVFLGDTLDTEHIGADYSAGVLTLTIPVHSRPSPARSTSPGTRPQAGHCIAASRLWGAASRSAPLAALQRQHGRCRMAAQGSRGSISQRACSHLAHQRGCHARPAGAGPAGDAGRHSGQPRACSRWSCRHCRLRAARRGWRRSAPCAQPALTLSHRLRCWHTRPPASSPSSP